MAFNCGFFNSINGDRKYNAEQMNNPYSQIISDGVFGNPSGGASTDLQVQASIDLNIIVKQGRGMFAGKWVWLDADMPLTIPTPHVSLTRIDSVIVRIDNSPAVRAGAILYREGTAASTPTPPALNNSDSVKEFRLCNITVNPNVTSVTQANITDTRGGSECGFIHNLLWDTDITAFYAQWEAQFDEWFQTLRETLATATIITSFTGQYVSTDEDETVIPIPIERYNRALDVLQVYINGLFLTEDVDYTITGDHQITLTLGVDAATPISFVVYKSVDGSEAETVVRQVEELFGLLPTATTGGVEISVANSGDVLASFAAAGVGLHTMYSAYGAANSPKLGAFRYFGHLTAAGYGWIIGFMADGSVFTNYLDNGTWQGWRTIYEDVPRVLYFSETGIFPNEGAEIVPSKPLSECKNGWVLEFSGYDDTNNTPRDVYAQSVIIPKRNYKQADWNGETVAMPLVYQYDNGTDETLMCIKNFFVYNNKLVSGSINATGKQRKIVLRAIYEY